MSRYFQNVSMFLVRKVCSLCWLTMRSWRKLCGIGFELSLKHKLKQVGPACRFRGISVVTAPENISIGTNVHIGDNATIRAERGVRIESHVHIARNLVLYTINHNYEGERLPYDHTTTGGPVHIGQAAWIGINVTILPNVSIGEGAIIGAGSVVAKDVPALAVAVGNPCRVVKYRDRSRFEELKTRNSFCGVDGRPLDITL